MAEEKEVKKVSKTLTEQELAQVAHSTKAKLDKQPKYTIRIRKEKDGKSPNYETVQVNGYTYTIMKGVDVEVPKTVYDILVEAGII